MYKRFLQLLIVIIILFIVSGCKADEKYIISFESNGGTLIDPIITDGKSLVENLETPEKAGFKFAGWYYDEEFIYKFAVDSLSSSPIESDII